MSLAHHPGLSSSRHRACSSLLSSPRAQCLHRGLSQRSEALGLCVKLLLISGGRPGTGAQLLPLNLPFPSLISLPSPPLPGQAPQELLSSAPGELSPPQSASTPIRLCDLALERLVSALKQGSVRTHWLKTFSQRRSCI